MDNNYKNHQYFSNFAKLVTGSYCNNIYGYNRIKKHILNYGYITIGKLSEYMPINVNALLGYNRELNENYGWTGFGEIDSCFDLAKRGNIYFDITIKTIRLTLPINLKENKMKKDAIAQLNSIINANPDCDAEGTNDTLTVRISDEDYEYSIVRKDKVKYLPLKDILIFSKYDVIPNTTLWEQKHNVVFNSVIRLNRLVSMTSLAQLFPRNLYSYQSRSKLYDDLAYALLDPFAKTKGEPYWLVYIGKDSKNEDVLELMRVDEDSSFFDGKRVIINKGGSNDNI